MQLYSIKGGTEEELLAKKYQIGVGISMGNKWFTVDNIQGLVEWSLKYSKGLVIIYVADDIHSINLEVRKRISREKAQKLSYSMGSKILEEVRLALINNLDIKNFDRLVFARWKDLIDEDYISKTNYLYSIYEGDLLFRERIYQTVKSLIEDEERIFYEEDIHKLGTYLIEEFTEVLCRVKIAGNECDAYAYPYSGLVTELVDNIQQGLISLKV
jgi:tRNA-dependent cyclodipeptide synthase